jgi:sterol desaturase/sphingolipid hydroxylase (fatty acid hydroxylase superfamily)
MLLSYDLAEYAFHRLQHAWRPLWLMHALHHSDPDMNVTTTNRHFWADRIVKTLLLYPLVDVIFRFGENATLICLVAMSYNFVPHADLRWSYGRFWVVLNGPQYHRIHHSRDPAHHNRNFAALFPVFDLLFGTAYRPLAGEFPQTGLHGSTVPPGLVPMLAWPWPPRRQQAAASAQS